MEISKLSKSDQQLRLFNYAQLFTIDKKDQILLTKF